MKDERKIFWICLMFAVSIILFTIKASAQTGNFTQLVLKDKYGVEELEMASTIKLLTGKLEITEDGQTWTEKILLQTKSGDTCGVETLAGYYLLIVEGTTLKTAYLRSFVGLWVRIGYTGMKSKDLPGFFDQARE